MMNSSQDLGVRVIVAYENKRVGQVIFPPGTLRQRLVQCGFVEPVEAPKKTSKILKALGARS